MSDTPITRCPFCGANNRIAVSKLRAGLQPICGRCSTPLDGWGKPLTVTDATFAEEIERSPLPVLLDLWAPWCGPCRTIAPMIEEVAGEMAGRVRVAKLNVDENPNTAARYRVQSIPTLLLLKNGREAERMVGVRSKAEVLRRLEQAA